MKNYKQVDKDTYIAVVTAEHWYYGSIFHYYQIILNDEDEDGGTQKILEDNLKNENDFRFINWERATLTIDFVIDGKVYTKTTVIE